MCVSKGAPKKPAYGPCNETHGRGFATPTTFYGNSGTVSADTTWTYSATGTNDANSTHLTWI